jgi:hypothetical protein
LQVESRRCREREDNDGVSWVLTYSMAGAGYLVRAALTVCALTPVNLRAISICWVRSREWGWQDGVLLLYAAASKG